MIEGVETGAPTKTRVGEAARASLGPPFEAARSIADAVLYEGYSLYPYRASAPKNQLRWQFGVLVPPDYRDTAEPSSQQTECLLGGDDGTRLRLVLRFLHLQARTIEALDGDGRARPVESLTVGDDEKLIPWEEGVEVVVETEATVDELLRGPIDVPFTVDSDQTVEEVEHGGAVVARVCRTRGELRGRLRLTATRLDTAEPAFRLRSVVDNLTAWAESGVDRQTALRGALIGAHTMIAVEGGAFLSLLEPPPWAEAAAEGCRNLGTFPVLVGEPGSAALVLSSPIVLYDHPRVAPESPGDLFDATEIDELLTFRTLTLTEEEKREARATDERVRALIDRVEDTTPEALEKLHGAIRARGFVGEADRRFPLGSRVRLRPARRRADAHDMFLDGRTATVEGTLRDVDGSMHVAVTVDDDPAADLNRRYGRFHYFGLDEVEPLGENP